MNYAIEGGCLFGASARRRKLSAMDVRKVVRKVKNIIGSFGCRVHAYLGKEGCWS